MKYANHTLWSKFTPIVCNTVHAMQLVSFHINMSKSLGTWIGQGTWDCGQWTLDRWTAPSQWNCLSSAVICKSRSFASQVENWVNAMLGGIATESEMETKKQFPEHQTDYMETRSGSGFGMGGHGWRWWRCLCSAFVLQPVQNTKDNKTPSATHEHEPKSQAKTWRTEFRPYMLYTLRIFQLLEINKN